MRRREKQLRCSDVGTQRNLVGWRDGLIDGLLPWMILLVMSIAVETAAETLPTGSSSPSSAAEYVCGRLDTIDPDPGPAQRCKGFTVTNCPGPDAMVTLRRTLNDGDDGTVIFFSGEEGKKFWARFTSPFPGPGHLMQRDLSTGANDFKIVEVRWHDGWHSGTPVIGQGEGPAKLACRVEAVVQWVISHETYHQQGTPMCATGQSGGANQLAYTLTHYAMEADYQSVIFTSGPPYSDLELGCRSCGEESGCYSAKGRWRLDTAYGTPTDPTFIEECPDASEAEECATDPDGPFKDSLCINHRHEVDPVPGFADDLYDSSVALNTSNWDYLYPNLPVFFIFGQDDDGGAKHQGELYRDVLDSDPLNIVDSIELVGVDHHVNKSVAGTAQILDDVLASCVLP